MERLHACWVSVTNYAGFEAVEFGNACLSMIVIPSLGGKIVSLYDCGTATEWLWKNPQLNFIAPDETTPYVRNLGGWDECFPSVCETKIANSAWRKHLIGDHGEIWRIPWTYSWDKGATSLTVRTRVQVPGLPCFFERAITIVDDSSELRLDYHVENNLKEDLPFIWSCHPTLSAFPGDELILPAIPVVLYDSFAKRFGYEGKSFLITEARDVDGRSYDFSRLPCLAGPVSLKLFTQKGAVDKVALKRASGAALVFQVDPLLIPHIGIWLNFKAWSAVPGGDPAYCVAIEPCTNATDDLKSACATQANATIKAGKARDWQIKVSVQS